MKPNGEGACHIPPGRCRGERRPRVVLSAMVPVLGTCPGALVTGTVAKWLTISGTSAAIDVSPT